MITLTHLKNVARGLDLRITKEDGEYRITSRLLKEAKDQESVAYYTDDAQDALDTMYAWRGGAYREPINA